MDLYHNENKHDLTLHEGLEEKDLHLKALEDCVCTSLYMDGLVVVPQNHAKEGEVKTTKRKRQCDEDVEEAEGKVAVAVKEKMRFCTSL